MPHGLADWCSKAVLYVNLSWMCCVCHVTVSRLVSINDSSMGGHSAEMSGKSSICHGGEADPSFGPVYNQY